MRRFLARSCLILGFGGFLLLQAAAPTRADNGRVNVLTIQATINPITAGHLSRGIDLSVEEGARLVVVILDTPGGLLSSTRTMVEKILESEVPVVVYVSPPGAQAASAGTFITAAAHLAVMAPSTNIGAASPVGSGGEDLPETLASKATQNAAAFIRSIAEERGRNAQALEETVLDARSFSATEALENNIVDFIAGSMDELLTLADGRVATTSKGSVTLVTQGVEVRKIDMNLRERFLNFLANPDIAFLLLSIGSLGIMIEFLNPGVIFPGVFGAIALVLSFVALGNMPFSWAGVGLIVFAMILFFAELQAPGIGVFGIGGAISFVLGAFLLFGGFGTPAIPTPSFRVNLWVISTMTALLLGFLLFFFRMVVASRRAVTVSMAETVAGMVGFVTSDLAPTGTVQVASEIWSAVSDSGEVIRVGEEVMVLEIEGLTLNVFRVPKNK